MVKKVYFIGISGISMSSLAVFMRLQNCEVSGSDLCESENLKALQAFGIKYHIGHAEENIKQFNPNLVIINYAIHEDNEELIWARNHKKRVISRAELLGKLSKNFKKVIAISGTHGKTTTTALTAEIFVNAGLRPTVHVGGILKLNNSNFLIGDKKYFITEACEYKNSFLSLSPNLGAVLNIEPDHLDFFKNINEIQKSFDAFLQNSKTKLFQISDFKYCLKNEKFEKFYSAENITQIQTGYIFDLCENDKILAHIKTNFLGEHNVKNALVSAIIALQYKIKIHTIKKTIKNYHGVKRRFEEIAQINNCAIIHDYAHHPTEIRKVITQAKSYGKVLTVFQPHTFSRTKKLFNDFLTAFDESDGLILAKTYPARERESEGISAKTLFKKMQNFYNNKLVQNAQNIKNNNFVQNIQNNQNSYFVQSVQNGSLKISNHSTHIFQYCENFNKIQKTILDNLKNYDCILILGAGDINQLAEKFKNI